MRINRYVATASGLSRRHADRLVEEGRVKVDGKVATTAQDVLLNQIVTLDNKPLHLPLRPITVALNKPVGFVVSRRGQGAQTIYSLLPNKYQNLKPIGRLDKDSSGLLLLSNDGQLIQNLAHPSNNKEKIYNVTLNRSLTKADQDSISRGIKLKDGFSHLYIRKSAGQHLTVAMEEGRNRQIRRTFDALGYNVIKLERIAFSVYTLNDIKPGMYKEIKV